MTTSNPAGTVLIDNLATFITDGVQRGAVVINFSDQSITEVLEVLAETQLRSRVLRAGTTNQFTSGDAYKIWNIEQCEVQGGNLVAIDGYTQPAPLTYAQLQQGYWLLESGKTIFTPEDLQSGKYKIRDLKSIEVVQ